MNIFGEVIINLFFGKSFRNTEWFELTKYVKIFIKLLKSSKPHFFQADVVLFFAYFIWTFYCLASLQESRSQKFEAHSNWKFNNKSEYFPKLDCDIKD